MLNELFKLVLLSIACGATSMTVSKAKVFSPLRKWIASRSTFIGEGMSCPYCMSHWIACVLVGVYFPRPLNSGYFMVDFFTSVMLTVALASITARTIFSAYAVMSQED